MGQARFGKTRKLPRRPRLRAIRGTPEHPRLAVVPRPTDPQEHIDIAVPAIVTPEEFAMAQEKLEDNRKRCRIGPEGPRHLLQGLLVCGHCGHAVIYQPGDRRRTRPRGYYRCTGTNTHRYGGVRVCHARSLVAEGLEQAVWQDVVSLLTQPQRLRQYFAQRDSQDPQDHQAHQQTATLLHRQEQGLERLIDIYTEGAISKGPNGKVGFQVVLPPPYPSPRRGRGLYRFRGRLRSQ